MLYVLLVFIKIFITTDASIGHLGIWSWVRTHFWISLGKLQINFQTTENADLKEVVAQFF